MNISISTLIELIYKDNKDNKKIDFKDINFSGISSKESDNIQDNTIQLNELIELTDAQFVGYDRNYFVINGTFDFPGIIVNNDIISIPFINITKNNKDFKNYNCTVNTNQKNSKLINLK